MKEFFIVVYEVCFRRERKGMHEYGNVMQERLGKKKGEMSSEKEMKERKESVCGK